MCRQIRQRLPPGVRATFTAPSSPRSIQPSTAWTPTPSECANVAGVMARSPVGVDFDRVVVVAGTVNPSCGATCAFACRDFRTCVWKLKS